MKVILTIEGENELKIGELCRRISRIYQKCSSKYRMLGQNWFREIVDRGST